MKSAGTGTASRTRSASRWPGPMPSGGMTLIRDRTVSRDEAAAAALEMAIVDFTDGADLSSMPSISTIMVPILGHDGTSDPPATSAAGPRRAAAADSPLPPSGGWVVTTHAGHAPMLAQH